MTDDLIVKPLKIDKRRVLAKLPPPGSCKIALVGEAPGQEELMFKEPFVGSAGRELNRMLRDADLLRSECFVTNVFSMQPPENKIKALTTEKKFLPKDYKTPYLAPGQYVLPEFLPEVQRLKAELEHVKPNLVIALGNTALWALRDEPPKIGAKRGTVMQATLVPDQKLIATYHPAHVLRNWSFRVVVLTNFLKAKREAEFAELKRIPREVWLYPTIKDLYEFEKRYINNPDLAHLRNWIISHDVETVPKRAMMTCISISPTKFHSIIVPFVDRDKPDYSYWATAQEEFEATMWVKRQLERADKERLAQNGLYDVQYEHSIGIQTRNVTRDTMLRHHSLYPEMTKDLGFLNSVYTDEIAHKTLRPRGAFSDTTKRES